MRQYPVRFGGGPGEKAAMTSRAVYPTSAPASGSSRSAALGVTISITALGVAMTTVFLSYSTKDHYFAELAGIKLAEAGITLWRDQG
jgi:hypothetical protein